MAEIPPAYEIEPLHAPSYKKVRWASDPVPIDGELMSSWLARIAIANKMPLAAFVRYLHRHVGPLGDVDAVENPHLVQFLARQTGHGTDVIESLAWFSSPAAHSLRRMMVPVRICPRCWEQDGTDPYLRREWRMAPVVICPEHNRRLLSACPSCGVTIRPLHSKDRVMTTCRGCGLDLIKTKSGKGNTLLCRGQQVFLHLCLVAIDIEAPEYIAALWGTGFRYVSRRLGRTPKVDEVVLDFGNAAAGGGALVRRMLPVDSLVNAMSEVATSAVRPAWPAAGPLPVRFWPADIKMGPVYAEDLDAASRSMPISKSISLYDLLNGYCGCLNRNPGLWSSVRDRPLAIYRVQSEEEWCQWGELFVRYIKSLPPGAEKAPGLLRQIRSYKEARPYFIGTDRIVPEGLILLIGPRLWQFLVPTHWAESRQDEALSLVSGEIDRIAVTLQISPEDELRRAMITERSRALFERGGWRNMGKPTAEISAGLSWIPCDRPLNNLYQGPLLVMHRDGGPARPTS